MPHPAPKVDKERQALEVVKRLRAWRKKNGLTRRQASEVMILGGVPITATSFYLWEAGRKKPNRMSSHMVGKFMEEHPIVTDAPVFKKGKKSKLSSEDVAEMRKLHEQEQTMKKIADRFGVTESYVSHILSGDRLKRVTKGVPTH